MEDPRVDVAVPYCLGKHLMPKKATFSYLVYWFQLKRANEVICNRRWRAQNEERVRILNLRRRNPEKTLRISEASPSRKLELRAMKARHMRTWRAKKRMQKEGKA